MSRLDQYLSQQYPVLSRSKAQALIEAGQVLVNEKVILKPSFKLEVTDLVRFSSADILEHQDVSRAGNKLRHYLESVDLKDQIQGKVWLDVGQSTGGFTQVLLECSAFHVLGIDVGKDQLDISLREDPRVSYYEGVNAKYLLPDAIIDHLQTLITPANALGGLVMDVSFISILKIIPNLLPILSKNSWLIILIKPQFEQPHQSKLKTKLTKYVLNDEEAHERLAHVLAQLKLLGIEAKKSASPSVIRGKDGNLEFLAAFKKGPKKD